ncbi:MAG: homocysteine S-methyltransferase [Flavobacteriaceae bacterium]|nr:homocysteine S-methyltransferase [Flavobacteriaceae bacterium]|tara:strand:+ start:225 stop:1136 length:912 start_codon:yes stop_codon:yes gene_type:complete
MLERDFFKQVRILDGGMGQELLARGLKTTGTLWSASALLKEEFHKLILDAHLDFINAGAEIIVTTTFSSRRLKLRENDVEDKFEELNKKAGELAIRAKEKHPDVLVAGGLPPQYLVYEADTRSDYEILENFFDQAKIISPFVDFFYLDVLSSIREIKLAVQAIESLNKPYLIGAHISEGVKLPSGEKISEIVSKMEHNNLLGLMLSCVSPENYELNLQEIKCLGYPFGFKLNGFARTNPVSGYTKIYNKNKTINPNEFLGTRKDLTPIKLAQFAQKFKDAGATILGGCCETTPSHIKEISKLR